jgi:hypothetical protein
MKEKSLSFVFITFSESGLFNALRAIQIEKPSLAPLAIDMCRTHATLDIELRRVALICSIEIIAHNSTFYNSMPGILNRGPTRQKKASWVGL